MKNRKGERGSMIIITVIFAIVLGMLAASIISYQATNFRQNITSNYRVKALFLAEAGVQRALYELNFVPSLANLT